MNRARSGRQDRPDTAGSAGRSTARHVLFVQGGGAGAHDDWDSGLVRSLRRELGDGYEIRYPRMPDEDDPGYFAWSLAIRQEMAALAGGAVVVGHSVGGTILVNALPSGRRTAPSGR